MVLSSQRDLLENCNFCLWLTCVVLAVMGLRLRPLEASAVKSAAEPVAVMALTLDGFDPAQVAEANAQTEATATPDVVPAEQTRESLPIAEPQPVPALAQELQTPLPELPEMPVAKPEKMPEPMSVKATESTVAATNTVNEPKASAVPTPAAAKSKGESAPRQSNLARKSSGVSASAEGRSRGVATTLTLGQGQGRQPAPIYPLKARRAFQQGTVTVEFIVAENGEVSSAWLERPCQWPILNDVAVETIRQCWHFDPGTTRHFRIPIVFTLE